MEAGRGVTGGAQGPARARPVEGGGGLHVWQRLRPRVRQTGRGRVHRGVIAQSVMRLASGRGRAGAAPGVNEGSPLSVDLLPLLDRIQEHLAQAAASRDLSQLLFLLLKFVALHIPVGLDLVHLVLLLHGLRPPPPPRLVRVQEGRGGEVVSLNRNRLLRLDLLPVRVVRHLNRLLVVHVRAPRPRRLRRYGLHQSPHPRPGAGAPRHCRDLATLVRRDVEVHGRVRGLPIIRLDGAAEAGH